MHSNRNSYRRINGCSSRMSTFIYPRDLNKFLEYYGLFAAELCSKFSAKSEIVINSFYLCGFNSHFNNILYGI